MPLDWITGGAALLAAALLLVAVWAVVRHAPRSRAQDDAGRGEFRAALDAYAAAPAGDRDARLAAAAAAKHLLDFERARELVAAVLAEDPGDGEAWLELGLVEAYAGDADAADRALRTAAAHRADLAESITLHRAWVALGRGDRGAARRLFDEVEAPLETKLRTDLGPGEPLFSEWFLHAAALWAAFGDRERAAWARREGRRAAPESRLPERIGEPG